MKHEPGKSNPCKRKEQKVILTGCIKKTLNRFEIALNFTKQLVVASACVYSVAAPGGGAR